MKIPKKYYKGTSDDSMQKWHIFTPPSALFELAGYEMRVPNEHVLEIQDNFVLVAGEDEFSFTKDSSLSTESGAYYTYSEDDLSCAYGLVDNDFLEECRKERVMLPKHGPGYMIRIKNDAFTAYPQNWWLVPSGSLWIYSLHYCKKNGSRFIRGENAPAVIESYYLDDIYSIRKSSQAGLKLHRYLEHLESCANSSYKPNLESAKYYDLQGNEHKATSLSEYIACKTCEVLPSSIYPLISGREWTDAAKTREDIESFAVQIDRYCEERFYAERTAQIEEYLDKIHEITGVRIKNPLD